MDFERIGNTLPLPAFEYLRPEDGSLQGTARRSLETLDRIPSLMYEGSEGPSNSVPAEWIGPV